MDIFEKIARKFKLVEEKSTTEQIMEKRGDLKLNLAVKLYEQGFSDEEIENILQIIISAEDEINGIKKSLVGTNVNQESGEELTLLNEGKAKIKAITLKMNEDLQNAIQTYTLNHNQQKN